MNVGKKSMENLYIKILSKILWTKISENLFNLQTITIDDNISLVRKNIYNSQRKMVPTLPKNNEWNAKEYNQFWKLKTDLNEQFLLTHNVNAIK